MSHKNHKTTKFIYMGDPQSSRISGTKNDYTQWSALLARAARMCWPEPEEEMLLVLGGDLVNKSADTEEWVAFFDALHNTERQLGLQPNTLKILTPTGNHTDKRTYAAIPEFAANVSLPSNGPEQYEQNFYSYDSGCIHFMILDSNYMGNRNKDAYKYIGYWMKANLSVSTNPVNIAVFHHPVVTMGTSFDDEMRAKAIKDNYMKLFDRYGIDLILCGHQHMYSRATLKTKYNKPDVTQIMGVSGTKYFDAFDSSQLDFLKEFVSVATIIETDGESISIRTIDPEGNIIDEFSKSVRPLVERHCDSCINYSKCGGTGRAEMEAAEAKARELGNPLEMKRRGGIIVKGPGEIYQLASDEFISGLQDIEVTYSAMQAGKNVMLEMKGKPLRQVLSHTGIDVIPEQRKCICHGVEYDFDDLAICFMSQDGRQKTLKAEDIFMGMRFEGEGAERVEAIIKSPLYDMACGQSDSKEYSGRKWAKDIAMIELFLPGNE